MAIRKFYFFFFFLLLTRLGFHHLKCDYDVYFFFQCYRIYLISKYGYIWYMENLYFWPNYVQILLGDYVLPYLYRQRRICDRNFFPFPPFPVELQRTRINDLVFFLEYVIVPTRRQKITSNNYVYCFWNTVSAVSVYQFS